MLPRLSYFFYSRGRDCGCQLNISTLKNAQYGEYRKSTLWAAKCVQDVCIADRLQRFLRYIAGTPEYGIHLWVLFRLFFVVCFCFYVFSLVATDNLIEN